MNKNFVFLVFLFFLSAPVLASNPRINDFNAPTTATANNDVNLAISVSGDSISGTLWLYENGSPITSQPFNGTDQNYFFVRAWATTGPRQLKAKIADFNFFSDENALDNEIVRDINVVKGVDFVASAITIAPSILLPLTNTIVTATVKNDGDQNFLGNIDIQFYLDSNPIGTAIVSSLAASEIKQATLNYVLDSNFYGTHTLSMTINPTHSIPEFTLTNNSAQVIISDSTDADLIPTLINFDGDITKEILKTFRVTIQNAGGTTANNVLMRVYLTSISTQNKIFEATIPTVQPYESIVKEFSYSFPNAGQEKIIVYLDPLNNIVESDVSNNLLEKVVEINDIDYNGLEASSLFFNIYSQCVAYLTNGDRLVVNSINYDQNLFYTMSFAFYSSDGSIIMSETKAEEGYENITPGRTLRIASIAEGIAKVFLVYQKPVAIAQSNCDIDISNLVKENNDLKTQLQDAKDNLAVCSSERETARNNIDRVSNERDACNSNLNICNSTNATFLSNWAKNFDENKSALEMQFYGLLSTCRSELQQCHDSCDAEMVAYKNTNDAFKYGVLAVLVGITAYVVYSRIILKRKRKGTIKNIPRGHM